MQCTSCRVYNVDTIPGEVSEDQCPFLGRHFVLLGPELVQKLFPHGLEETGGQEGWVTQGWGSGRLDDGRLGVRKDG